MTNLIEDPPDTTTSSPAQKLRGTMAAVALHFTWFGVRKSLNTEQKAQAADAFGAEGSYLSAGKKLFDTSHPAFKAVTALKSQIVQFSKSMSLPYPEPGIRLIRRDEIGMFDTRLTTLRQELDEAVSNLSDHFSELKSAARRRLGRLYSSADYPETLAGLFGVTWEYPNCEPPAYLQQLSPELFEEESRRVAARFVNASACRICSRGAFRWSPSRNGSAQRGRPGQNSVTRRPEPERVFPAVSASQRAVQRTA
jgi:hypothetical protein